MQNVLIFPKSMPQKISGFAKIRNFLNNRKILKLIEKENQYKEKIDFLKSECYKYYLEKILNYRHKAKIVDFPRFMYKERMTICSEAMYLSEKAVEFAEQVYGKKHIEKCYRKRRDVIKK